MKPVIKPETRPTSTKSSTTADEARTERSTLDAMLVERAIASPPASSTSVCVVGECVEARHPSLRGRILVRWKEGDGAQRERWLPTLQGLPVREADRVVLLRPSNGDELVVTGVVDGFARRPDPERSNRAMLELRRDEAVRIVGSDGRDLMEVFEGDRGPVVRLLHEDLDIATSGRLRIRARQLQLQAEQGKVEIEATDDIVVRGEVIRLN